MAMLTGISMSFGCLADHSRLPARRQSRHGILDLLAISPASSEGIHVPDFAVVRTDGCHNLGMAIARVDHGDPSGEVDVAFDFYIPDLDVESTTG
jgi:hypothetical protein